MYILYVNRQCQVHLSRNMRKPTMWFLTRSDTNQAVQLLEMARVLKFCIKEVEVLYFPSSENKDADQLRGYREADLRLCFHICRLLVFSWHGSFYRLPRSWSASLFSHMQIVGFHLYSNYTKYFLKPYEPQHEKPAMWTLTRSDTNQAVDLVGNPGDRFSRVEAQLSCYKCHIHP